MRRRRRSAALAAAPRDAVVLSRLELHRHAARAFDRRPDLAAAFPADHVRTLLAVGRPDAALEAGLRHGSTRQQRLTLALAAVDPAAALDLYRGGEQALRAGLAAAVGDQAAALALCAQSSAPAARLIEASLLRNSPDAGIAWRAAFAAYGMTPPEAIDSARPVSVTNATAASAGKGTASELVSVIMPARNASAWVGAAVRSVLAQGHAALEFLFVDDSSTDETARVALEAAGGDSRFHLLTHPVRRGAYGARNTALKAAKGRWVAFQDADEWAHPDRLTLQIAAMERTGGAAVSGRGIRVDADGVLRARGVFPLARWAPSTLMIRREAVLARAGVFDEVLSGADNEYWWRLTQLFGPARVRLTREPLILGAARGDSLTGAADSGFGSRGYNLDRLRYWEAWSRWHLRNVRTPDRLRLAGGERPFRISETLSV